MKDMAPARSAGKSQGGIVGARALWHMSQTLNSNEAGGGVVIIADVARAVQRKGTGEQG